MFRPAALVLAGLAGCTGMDVASILQKKRLDVSRFEISTEGDQAEDHPRRYTRVRIMFTVYGTGIKPEAVERAIDLSQNKYCSVMASLNAEVEHTYEIKEV